MNSIKTPPRFRNLNRKWTDPSGSSWRAILVRISERPTKESEIQIEGNDIAPERVLCVGLTEQHFRHLSIDDLDLIRRAALARSGFLWLDTRKDELWWVDEKPLDESELRPTYSNLRWSGMAHFHPGQPITLLGVTDHQRLLDEAREGSP